MQHSVQILVKKVNDLFICHVPSLSLIIKDKDLDVAIRQANSKISNNLSSNQSFDLTSFIRDRFKKFSVAITVSTLLAIVTYSLLVQIIDHRYLRFERKTIEALNPTPEKQQERIIRFEKKLDELKPYINILKRLNHD